MNCTANPVGIKDIFVPNFMPYVTLRFDSFSCCVWVSERT